MRPHVTILDLAETDSPFLQPEPGNRLWAVEITLEASA
jgi:hypothetical protein